jgi:hypothetical protein
VRRDALPQFIVMFSPTKLPNKSLEYNLMFHKDCGGSEFWFYRPVQPVHCTEPWPLPSELFQFSPQQSAAI